MSIQRITIQTLHGIFTDAYSKEDSARGQLNKQAFMPWDLNSASIRLILEKLHFSIGDFVWGRYRNIDPTTTDKADGWTIRKCIEVEKVLLEYSSMDDSATCYLIEAARNGDLSIVKDILESGAEPDSTNSKGETALGAASRYGHIDVVKLLIDKGADANAVVDIQLSGEYFASKTALCAATRGKHTNVVELLIQRGADVNSCSPLSDAIQGGELDIIKLLIQEGAGISDEDGTALHVATGTYNVKLNIVQFLLDQGADVSARRDFDNNTPLQRAAFWGEDAILKLLIERGADVNAEGGLYGNALQTAAYWGRLGAVKLLIAEGANINATAGEEGTALEAAASRCHLEVVKYLLEQGADVNAKGKHESAIRAAKTPPGFFFSISAETRKAVINLLRQYGATD
ncbi:hypothetical protein VKT23_017053 [Stygiomarasmius scandens]|uniref:Uncharacterized protein n=1 Tax=Marasmiellus scandens TaxID=2682957 RepID=A0ABR1IT94_9AGAR